MSSKGHATGREANSSGKAARLQFLLRALSSRNYRLFFAGQSISLVGTWMQQVAMSWLVYRLTGSMVLLGTVGFAGQIPTFLLAPLAGVLADRLNRRRLILWTQSFAMLQAIALALLVFTSVIQVWQIIFLSVILGIVNAFDIPVRQSFVVEMVENKNDLPNAIALNSSMVNGARLIGPSIAGLLIAAVGEGFCFLLNGASYLAVIFAIGAMRIQPMEIRAQRQHVILELKEGFLYAFGFGPIRSILLLISLISLMGMPYAVLLPVFAKDILHGGAHTYGFLMGAAGVGSLAGTLFLASRRSVLGLGRIIATAACIFGAGIAAFAFSHVMVISLLFLCLSGFGAMVVIASSNTILQTIVDDDKRGRVMSFFTMSFMGMTPFGSLLVGVVAERLGVEDTLLFGGAACFAGGLYFARQLPAIRNLVRPIYRRLGIIPEVATGMQTAAELIVPPEEE
ncbi:MFS transporter [Geotalea sp. SG265]|uniref:MFS transporter n=1 Tax=Geotalea sp. SG265 TaxID=2922867 RepID=UPI001FAECAE2|nr:MFS transporter [Geotalea sp. SG265]